MSKNKDIRKLNVLVFKNGKFSVNPELALHFQTTHGIPPEMFFEMVWEKLPAFSYEKGITLRRRMMRLWNQYSREVH